MKFLLPSLLAAVAVSATPLTSDTPAGQKLLSQARLLNAPEDGGRELNDNNNYYTSWMTKYSMKWEGCHSIPQFERDEGMRSVLLAKFRMCPTDSCGKCPKSGEYIVEMRQFVEAYQQAKMSMSEYACEAQKENCEYLCENGMYNMNNNDDTDDYMNNGNNNGNNNQNNNNNNNNNNNDEYCYYQCMADNDMSYCDNDDNNNNNGQGDMNLDEFMECRQLGGEDGGNNNNNNYQYNNNNNYQRYYQGAYCTSSGVYLGVFEDSQCTKLAPSGTFEKYYGYSLPTESLVGKDCISCKSPENNNNQNGNNNNNNNNNQNGNNQNYQYQDYYGDEEVFDVCEQLYEEAGKCETNLDTQYKNTGSCDLMHGTLTRLDAAFNNKRRPAVGLAWFFGISCAFLGAYVFWLHSKVLTRQQINLLPSLNGSTA